MSAPITLLAGAVVGLAAGSLLVPLTRRELAASVVRATATDEEASTLDHAPPGIGRSQWIALAAVSGFLPAYVLFRVGWSPNAVPPLLLLIGLVQLAYCDLAQRLLPKTLVHALSAAVIGSGVIVAIFTSEWERLLLASLGGMAAFALFFVVNLMNPRWMGSAMCACPSCSASAWHGSARWPSCRLFSTPMSWPSLSALSSLRRIGRTGGPRCPSASIWPWGQRWSC